MKRLILVLAPFLFFLPTLASAASHTYACADWFTHTYGSCASGTITFTATGQTAEDGDGHSNVASLAFPLSDSTNYYVTWRGTASSGSTCTFTTDAQNTGASTRYFNSDCRGDHKDVLIVPGAGNSNASGLVINTGSSGTFVGTIEQICISTTQNTCSLTPLSSASPLTYWYSFWW